MRISDLSSDVCSSDLAVLAALDRLLVHQVNDIEHFDHFRILFQLLEDVDALDLHQLVRRAGIAAEQALCGRKLRAFATGHEAPVRRAAAGGDLLVAHRSEEHTSELQSLMRISYAVFC